MLIIVDVMLLCIDVTRSDVGEFWAWSMCWE